MVVCVVLIQVHLAVFVVQQVVYNLQIRCPVVRMRKCLSCTCVCLYMYVYVYMYVYIYIYI
jgi:hypothetical protein